MTEMVIASNLTKLLGGFPDGQIFAFLGMDGSLNHKGALDASSEITFSLTLINGKHVANRCVKHKSPHLIDVFDEIFKFADETNVPFRKHQKSKGLGLTLVTFSGQQVLSALKDFNHSYADTKVVSLGHQFSSFDNIWIHFNDRARNCCYAKVLFRDVIKLAPAKTTLRQLGDLFNIPTTAPYYETKVLACYTSIVMSNLQLKGAKKRQLPITIANFATKFVESLERKDARVTTEELRGYISSNIPSRRMISNVQPLRTNPGFYTAIQSFRGGINVAYRSGTFCEGVLTDIDLKSAYNVGGHLIPKLTYSEVGQKLVMPTPAELVKAMEKVNGAYTVGTCQLSVIWSRDCDFIPLASYSPDDDGPHFVQKEPNIIMTLTDFWIAYNMGAKMEITEATIISQRKLSTDREMYFDALSHCGIAQDIFLQKRMKADNDVEKLLWKEAGNSIYGKTAQGIHGDGLSSSNKQRFLSSISDPFVASQYTAITRWHVFLLIQALKKVQPFHLLNITTDGILVSSKNYIDDNRLESNFSELASPIYQMVTKEFLNNTWFEFKGTSETEGFNLRTRLNGTEDGTIHAMSSISNTTPGEILEALHKHQLTYISTQRRFPTFAERKRDSKVKKLQSEEKMVMETEAKLSYDWSNKPTGFVKNGKLGYFVTAPFETLQEQNTYKENANKLLKRYFIYDLLDANLFLLTMDNAMNKGIKLKSSITRKDEFIEATKFLAYVKADKDDVTDFLRQVEEYRDSVVDSQDVKFQTGKTLKGYINKYSEEDISRREINWLSLGKISKVLAPFVRDEIVA